MKSVIVNCKKHKILVINITVIILMAVIAGFMGYIWGYNFAQKEASEKTRFVFSGQILSDINEFKKWHYKAEYISLTNSIMSLFKDDAKKDPDGMSFFADDIIESVLQKQPGFAIRLEEYATKEAREEMDRLRREINAERFEQQQKEIAGLKLARHQDQKKIADIVAGAQGTKALFGDLRKINEGEGGVPIIFTNESQTQEAVFVVKTKDHQLFNTYFLQPNRYMKLFVPPGTYFICHGKLPASPDYIVLTVTEDIRVTKHGESVSGWVTAPY